MTPKVSISNERSNALENSDTGRVPKDALLNHSSTIKVPLLYHLCQQQAIQYAKKTLL